MDITMHLLSVLKILVAGICGFLIGFERKNRAKEAGIRTHFIVATASALMMIVSQYASSDGDPTRIAAQVVSGIGFLGAGMIFVHNRAISGLTTAAGVWATSGIGMAIGADLYIEGIACTLIILGIQTLFRNFGWMKGHNAKQLSVLTDYSENKQTEIESLLKDNGIVVESTTMHRYDSGSKIRFVMSIETPSNMMEQDVLNLFGEECSIISH